MLGPSVTVTYIDTTYLLRLSLVGWSEPRVLIRHFHVLVVCNDLTDLVLKARDILYCSHGLYASSHSVEKARLILIGLHNHACLVKIRRSLYHTARQERNFPPVFQRDCHGKATVTWCGIGSENHHFYLWR
jgi:hypothetical protein